MMKKETGELIREMWIYNREKKKRKKEKKEKKEEKKREKREKKKKRKKERKRNKQMNDNYRPPPLFPFSLSDIDSI